MRVILDGVFNHTGRGFWPFHHVLENGAGSPYRDWFHLDARRPRRAVASSMPYPPRRSRRPARVARLPGVVGPARAAEAQHRQRRRPRVPAVGRRALAPVRHRRLAARRPGRDRRPAVLAGVPARCRAIRPDAYLVGEIWETAPDWVAGDRFDALMNYPLAEAILGYVGGSSLDMARRATPTTSTGVTSTRSTAPAFAARLVELLGRLRRGRRRGPAEPARLARRARGSRIVLGGDLAGGAHGDPAPGLLPGAPCIYYGDEVGLTGGNDPANRGGLPVGRGAPGMRTCAPSCALDDPAAGIGAGAAPRGDDRDRCRRGRRWPSSDGSTRHGSCWR